MNPSLSHIVVSHQIEQVKHQIQEMNEKLEAFQKKKLTVEKIANETKDSVVKFREEEKGLKEKVKGEEAVYINKRFDSDTHIVLESSGYNLPLKYLLLKKDGKYFPGALIRM